MKELGELVVSMDDFCPDFVGEVQAWATQVFSGWGTTKLVGDGLCVLRDRGQRDSKRNQVRCLKQWDVLRKSGLMEGHRREQVQDPLDVGEPRPAAPVEHSIHSATGHEGSADLDHITDRRDWTSLTAASEMSVQGLLAVMRHCSLHK